MAEEVAFEQGLEEKSGTWPASGVAPGFGPVTRTGPVEPKWLKALRVEAETRIPSMMIQKNW